jgi:O-antigen/teichoic acid export membrane protein
MVNTKNTFLRIYFWQIISFTLKLITTIIVTPLITKNPSEYGLFMLCSSFIIYLNYADLGILRPAQKFASEAISKNDSELEYKTLGFTIYILTIVSLIFTLLFIYFSIYPSKILSNLDSLKQFNFARLMFMALAIFSPFLVIQRLISLIYEVRLESYKFQKLIFISSLASFFSTFYFFGEKRYMIIEYFYFIQFINCIIIIVAFLYALQYYQLKIDRIAKHIKFNINIFLLFKKLAGYGLLSMICWFLFFEIDQLLISRLIGLKQLAIYTIAFYFPSIFKIIFNILISPINVKIQLFNNNDIKIDEYLIYIYKIIVPIFIIPIFVTLFFIKPLIINWVGLEFINSVYLSKFLLLIFPFSFISYITNSILVSKQNTKWLNVISILEPLIYFIGIIFTYNYLRINAFVYFKLLSFIISTILYTFLLHKTYNTHLKYLVLNILPPIIFSLIIVYSTSWIYLQNILLIKSKFLFLKDILIISLNIVISFFLYFLFLKNEIRKSLLNSLQFNLFKTI